MVKASKPEETVQPAKEKASKSPAKAKVPVIEMPRSIAVRQLAELLQVDSIQVIKQLMRTSQEWLQGKGLNHY